jgi:predicted dehydrogenase
MGRNHVKAYKRLPGVELIGVVDTNPERAKAVGEEFGVRPFGSVTDVIDKVDAVTVAVPTVHHAATAEPFIRRRIPVLVEKPLAATREAAEALAKLAHDHECLLQVGHTERFNPAVMALDRLTIHPKYIECQRVSPFSFRSIDIGVVLDMMIHDIDIVLHLARSEPAKVDAIGLNIVAAHEDMANARVTFANGCVANLTASRLAMKADRRIRVFSEEAYISLDYMKRHCRIIKKSPKLDLVHVLQLIEGRDPAEALAGMDFSDLVLLEDAEIDDHEPLLKELEEFCDCVRSGRRPRVSEIEGYQAVACATRIVEAIAAHQWDGRPDGRVGLAGPVRK